MNTTATRKPAAGPTVVKALSTRTITWWAFKRLAPGTTLTLFCLYAVPAIVHATGA